MPLTNRTHDSVAKIHGSEHLRYEYYDYIRLYLARSSRQFQTEMLGSESASLLAVSSCSVAVCEGGGGRLVSSHPAQYISV